MSAISKKTIFFTIIFASLFVTIYVQVLLRGEQQGSAITKVRTYADQASCEGANTRCKLGSKGSWVAADLNSGSQNSEAKALERPGEENGTPVACEDLAADLKVGDTGDDVVRLHALLQQAGFRGLGGSEYTNVTAAAIRLVQKEHAKEILDPAGLSEPTGSVSSMTRTVLNDLYGCDADPAAILPLESLNAQYSSQAECIQKTGFQCVSSASLWIVKFPLQTS